MILMNNLHTSARITGLKPSALALDKSEEQKHKVKQTNKFPEHIPIVRS
jgi:hypothetical protein